MSDFWNKQLGITSDDEEVSEYELLEEAEESERIAAEYAAQPEMEEASEEEIEEILEESSFDLNERESNVVYNARLRLEQARLYEMLINHNLFDGVEADPKAILNVQNELKHYIVARLEILLGLRERPKAQSQNTEDRFNDVEKDFLKQLAYKGTKGASVLGNPSPEEDTVTKAYVDRQPRINALSGNRNKTQPKKLAQSIQQKVNRTVEKPIPKQPQKKLVKPPSNAPEKTKKQTIKGGVAPRNLTPIEAEELALQELQKEKRKPFHKMNAKEKAEEIRRVNERHRPKPKPETAQPIMSDINQLQAKYMTEQQLRTSSQANQKFRINEIIANHVISGKNEE